MAFRFDWARCSLSSPILSATPRTLRLIGQTCLVQALVLVLFNIGQGLLLPAQLWVGKEIVDKAVSLIGQTGSQFPGLLFFLVGLRLLIMQAGRILEAWSRLVHTRAGFLLTRKVTHLVMNKAVSLELAHFDSANYYNKVELARREAGTRPLWMLQTLVDFIRVGIQSAGTVVLLSQFSWVAVVVTVVASAPGFIYELMFAKQNWSFTTENVPQVRAMNYLSRVLTTKEAAKEIRLFGLADYFIDKYHVSSWARKLDKKINDALAKVWRKLSYIRDVMSDFSYGKDIRLFGMKDFIAGKYLQEQKTRLDGSMKIQRVWLEAKNVFALTSLLQEALLYVWLCWRIQ